MLRNYFRIAWRNLRQNKLYSSVNILGLATGMTFAMLIGLWVMYERSFDTFHPKRDRVAVIMKKNLFNGEKTTSNVTPLPLYYALKESYPEITHITRLDWGSSHSVRVGENKFNKRGFYTDPDFLRMFNFPLLKGDVRTALKEPASIVLTASAASALFGKDDPIGKIVRLDNQYDLKVTAIAADVPDNSSLKFEFLTPFEFYIQENQSLQRARTQWGNNFLKTIVELKEGASLEAFSDKIKDFIAKKQNKTKESTLFVHPLSKWHLWSEFKDWKNTGGRIDYVRLFGIIGILVLVIACINFMNLATARSEKRAREVGIRKTIGSSRYQLIIQFLGESVLMAFIAFLIALLFARLLTPLLKDFGFNNISFSYISGWLVLAMLAACVLTGLLAGSYPALYLSSFAPVKVLKGVVQTGRSATLPRKILVITQFTFSIALIISTLIVFRQINYARNRPLGYNPDNLIQLDITSDLYKNFDILKHDLHNTGMVASVCSASSPMTSVWNSWDDFSWAGKDPNSTIVFSAISTDYDYDKTVGLKLMQGRFFSKEYATDSNTVILNEAAVKITGFKEPLGQHIKLRDKDLTVIGVADNMVQDDPFRPVNPAAIMCNPGWKGIIMLRLKDNADIRKALAAIQPVVEKYNPAYPFEYHFADDVFEKKFSSEKQVGKLAAIFACLAIFISCLGLFGIAAYTAERRIKEIGIRKVLGASITTLWTLLSRDFMLLVLIAAVIGSALAAWFMHSWLQKYDYRTGISYWIYLATSGLAILITLITVSFQAIRAALMNPVKSLRAE